MKRIIVLKAVFILFILCSIQYSQVSETRGNLLRINFTKPNIDLSDTLWNWVGRNDSGETYSTRCSNVFVHDSTTYLLFNSSGEDRVSHYPWINGHLYNTATGNSRLLFEDHPGYDNLGSYYYFDPQIRKTSAGVWIYYGRRGAAVFLRNDSLYQFQKVNNKAVIHFAGKVGDKELVVLEGTPYTFSYYLEDFSISPLLKLDQEISIEDNNNQSFGGPSKINYITGNLYLYQSDVWGVFCLSSFENNKISIIKRLKPAGDTLILPIWFKWRFVNGNLYYIESGNLVKENLDLSTNSFTNKQVVISNYGSSYSFDRDGNLFAHIKNDSLFIFSMKEEKRIHALDIRFAKFKGGIPIIDSPYVYLHQTLSVTDVKDEKELPTDFLLKGNYPNPFNPGTTINFVLSKRENVSIVIYNLLGEKVRELLREEKDAGEHFVIWNGKDDFEREVTSGVYFYLITHNRKVISSKMVLIK
ncbi:MAG: T9SS type A sorting domain-containing protein [Melioribacter sp.]|nr:T9SS type A sorting domain-containing protein [Melioribacter sp.]